jgi:L-gulonolactone oxidase
MKKRLSFLVLMWTITQPLVLAGIENDKDKELDILAQELENEISASSQIVEFPIKSYNPRIICDQVQRLFKPSTLKEVVEAISFARKNDMRVRTVGELHSINTLICTDGVMISTEKLNKIDGIEVFNGEETVLIEPGVKVGELSEWLHERDRSLGYAMIDYRGVSVGGAVATGSRGDSIKHPVVLASLVKSFKIVNFEGQVREYSIKNTSEDTLKALRTNLGLMGSVVQMRIKIEPQFNIETKSSIHSEKKLFERAGLLSVMSECDFGNISWFPHTKKFFKTCGIETEKQADPSVTNTSLSPKTPKFLIEPTNNLFQFGARHKKVNILLEKIRLAQLRLISPFSRENRFGKLVHKNHVIGYSHRIISSDLSEQMKKIPTSSWEVAIPLSKASEALSTIRDVLIRGAISLPFSGITIRYAPVTDDTLIAMSSAGGEFRLGEPAIFICMIVFEPRGFSSDEYNEYIRPYRHIIEVLIRDFSGRAHWGKNDQEIFRLQSTSHSFEGLLDRFSSIVAEFDPVGIFRNEFLTIAGVVNLPRFCRHRFCVV